MAKQTKSANVPAQADGAAPATAPAKDKVVKNERFIRVYNGDAPAAPSKKVAPQAQVIINAIEAAGKDGITREDLVKNLTGVLQTRQPVGRILSYYQKLIVEVGAVTVA